ncbi:uncharacterized protein LOC111898008 [Lactuca sativa]|uniref:uncharacterized protein LOC111898008 n=1 Tax=Lactuca sativa TaxID=4236 RepID=UPI000CD86D61|nr:uncharacterized protein LOC111898008 [Lactuca sativa]
MLELENWFMTLKKGSMYIDEYTNAFTNKMEFSLHIVPNELTKIDKYTKGLPWEYVVPIFQATTFEVAIRVAKSVEEMIKSRAANKVEVGKKRKLEGSSRSNKKRKFMNSGSNKFGGGGECTSNKRVCYGCNEEGHTAKDCPKKKEATRPNIPPRPKARAFNMTLEAARDEADVASDPGANYSFISHKFGGRLAFPVDKLDNSLLVEVANGKFISISNCIKNIVIHLNGNKFHEKFLPIELNGFDIVLGMDWLNANDAEILCRKRMGL